jgi:hypothetical protein
MEQTKKNTGLDARHDYDELDLEALREETPQGIKINRAALLEQLIALPLEILSVGQRLAEFRGDVQLRRSEWEQGRAQVRDELHRTFKNANLSEKDIAALERLNASVRQDEEAYREACVILALAEAEQRALDCKEKMIGHVLDLLLIQNAQPC